MSLLTPTPLSVYVLTFNSEKYLDALLTSIAPVADELVIVDSGSQDRTQAIAEKHGCRFIYHALDNFRDQREFALRACQHRMVLMLDSDEIPDAEFVEHIAELKRTGFTHEAYRIKRNWFVMGQPVRCMYPVESPDWTVRLVDQERVTFLADSRMVHEKAVGYASAGRIRGSVSHYTFESRQELARKLKSYSALAARDLVELGVRPTLLHVLVYPPVVWAKWYFVKGSWKDGRLGWTLSRYVWRYVFRKFNGARQIHLMAGSAAVAGQPAVTAEPVTTLNQPVSSHQLTP